MRVRWAFGLASASAFFCAFALSPARADEVEPNTNRPGGDYKDFEVVSTNKPFALVCKYACEFDEKCKAWTFVRSGEQGPKGHCWLKSSVPKANKDKCCISGQPVEHGYYCEPDTIACVKHLLTDQQYQGCLKSTPPPHSCGSGTTEWTELLQLHNAYRAMHGSPALTWSVSLAQGAQDWAGKCTPDPEDPSRFAHSGLSNGYGESLYWGTNATTKVAVDSWYAEIKNYDWNNPIGSYTSTDPNKAVGHFTQLVWKATKTLGCGVATCKGERYYVCRYVEQGNFNGDKPGVLDANVPRKR